MTSQIQKDYIYINEKEDKNEKRQNKRLRNSNINKQEFKNIKHDLNYITKCICLRDVEKNKCHDNTTSTST
jgi:hypothetical protein